MKPSVLAALLAVIFLVEVIGAKPDRGKPADPPAPAAAPTIKRTGPGRYAVTVLEWPHAIPMEFETLHDQRGKVHPSFYQLNSE